MGLQTLTRSSRHQIDHGLRHGGGEGGEGRGGEGGMVTAGAGQRLPRRTCRSLSAPSAAAAPLPTRLLLSISMAASVSLRCKGG